VGLTPSLAEESAFWDRLEQGRRSREANLASVDPAVASSLTGLHRAYPYVPAGAKLSLAKAGVPPDSPVAVTVAQGAQKRKAKHGFGWHSIGDFVSAGTDLAVRKPLSMLGSALAPVGDVMGDITRPVVRTGMMALSAPLEEAQGALRNIATGLPGKLGEITASAIGGAAAGGGLASVVPGLGTAIGAGVGAVVGGVSGLVGPEAKGKPQMGPQSSLGIAAGQILAGKKVETGSGYFLGHTSKLHEEQAARARAAASISGKGWTIGRSVADVVFEPGSTAYNVISGLADGVAALKLDPSAAALRNVARVAPGETGQLIRAGLIDAHRKTVLPEKVSELLASNVGTALKTDLAGEGNAYRISRIFGGQLDHRPDLLTEIADAADSTAIGDILARADVLGGSVAQVPKTSQARRIIPRLAVSSETGLTRRPFVNVPSGMVQWSDPAAAMSKVDAWQALGKVDAETRLANNDAFVRALAGPNPGRLPALDVVAKSISDVARAKGATDDVARNVGTLFRSSIEDARLFTATAIADGTMAPWLKLAGDNQSINSPHSIAELLNHGVMLPDQKELQRTVGILRQINKHPLVPSSTDAMHSLMGRWRQMAILRAAIVPRVGMEEQVRMATAGWDSVFKHPFSYVAGRVASRKEVSAVRSLEGTPLMAAEDMQGALNTGRGSQVLNGTAVAMKDRARIAYTDGADRFFGGWAEHELSHIHADPVMRSMSEMLASGESQGRRTLDDFKAAFWDGPLQGIRKNLQTAGDDAALLAERASSDFYVETLYERVTQMTRSDPDLLEAAVRHPANADRNTLRSAMQRLVDEGNAPAMVVGDRYAGGSLGKQAGALLDKVTDFGFEWLHTKPANFFSRSPVAEQSYWAAVERMMPALSPEDQARALALAQESKLPREVVARLEGRAQVAFEGEQLSMDALHTVAATEATNSVKKLLYDLSERKQWNQASRLVFPFAEAWTEMLTTWSKLLVENPAAIRRGGQVVEGARGSGFFYTDPQTGEEMFNYPGSAFVSKLLVGAPIPVTGSAAGLNLFAQNPVLPGFGPLAQIAANRLLPDKPEFDTIRDIVSPFGRAETGGGFLEAFAPAWAQKLRKFATSGESDRVFNNTVYDMGRYLVSTGKGDISTPEGQEQVTADAISMAKRMYLLRAFGSFTAPAAPQPKMVAEDKNGRVVTQFKIIEEFRALQEEDYETAPERFLELYGEGALLFMQSKTKGGGPPLEDTMDWARSNPDLVKRYGDTYHFFAPHAGEFSMTAYERQIASRERETLTPGEAFKLANSRVASMKMRQAREMVGKKPSDAQRKWLSDIQNSLIEEYPGYEPQAFDASKIPRAIRELEDAVADPRLAKTPAAKAIGTYLAARAQATEAAQSRLKLQSFSKAKAARPIREWLRSVAAALTEEYPDFGQVWDFVLSRELTSDVEEPTPTPTLQEA
jgi:hypothetical protein